MKQNDKILFESKPNINKSIYLIFIFSLALMYLIYMFTSAIFEKKSEYLGYAIIIILMLLGFLYFMLLMIYVELYRYKIKFHITENQLVINKFLKKEVIPINEIEKVTIVGSKNIVGLLYNTNVNAILFKLHNYPDEKYIIFDWFTYKNTKELLETFKIVFENRLTINKLTIKSLKQKTKNFLWAILLSLYFAVREFMEGEYLYGSFIFLIMIVFSISDFSKKNKFEVCEELFEIQEE